MVKRRQKYYAVIIGRKPGVADSRHTYHKMVDGFNDTKAKSFKSREEAELYLIAKLKTQITDPRPLREIGPYQFSCLSKKSTKEIFVPYAPDEIDIVFVD